MQYRTQAKNTKEPNADQMIEFVKRYIDSIEKGKAAQYKALVRDHPVWKNYIKMLDLFDYMTKIHQESTPADWAGFKTELMGMIKREINAEYRENPA